MDRIRCDCAIGFIFDKIGYGGSLQDDLEDVSDNPLGYVDVGSGWTRVGIVGRHKEKELNYKKVQLKLLEFPR